MEKNALFDIQNLNIGYSGKGKSSITVAKNLNHQFKSGELLALVGVNGIGKSTLIKTLTGLNPALSGELRLYGQELSAYSNAKRAQLISLVLTRKNAAPNLLVKEVLALGRQPYLNWWGQLQGEDHRIIQEVSSLLSLDRLLEKNCTELSDGQLQKVLLGRAIVQDTPLILLDEPTTHLDLEHKAELLRLLKQLCREKGKTILYSTHDIEWALEISDRMWFMDGKDNPVFTPEEGIASGLFDRLFSPEFLQFDRQNRRFKLQ